MWKEDWFNKLTPGEKVNHYFHRCNHLQSNIVDKNMAKAEIYAAQHRMLAMLDHRPMMSQKEIAREMGISTATVAVTLKKMEKSGYVEKLMDAEDNRSNKIRVTDRGKQTVGLGFDIMSRIDQDTVKDFTEEELEQFTGLLARYYARLNEMADIDYTGAVMAEKPELAEVLSATEER